LNSACAVERHGVLDIWERLRQIPPSSPRGKSNSDGKACRHERLHLARVCGETERADRVSIRHNPDVIIESYYRCAAAIDEFGAGERTGNLTGVDFVLIKTAGAIVHAGNCPQITTLTGGKEWVLDQRAPPDSIGNADVAMTSP
jgi:hypothetical protein